MTRRRLGWGFRSKVRLIDPRKRQRRLPQLIAGIGWNDVFLDAGTEQRIAELELQYQAVAAGDVLAFVQAAGVLGNERSPRRAELDDVVRIEFARDIRIRHPV